MKKSLIPLAAVIFALVVTSAGVLALTGGDSRGDDQYRVTVQFNISVTQEDIDEVAALLRTYDENLEFVVMEIFPPIGSALLALEAPAECSTIEAQLEAKSYVADASCAPWQPVDLDDSDAPVDQDNEATDASCEHVPLRSDCDIDPPECNQVHNIDACDQDDLDRLGEDSSLPVNASNDGSCEPVPLRSDCGIDLNECNQIHNIDACGEILNPPGPFDEPAGDGSDYFQVTIQFNTSYTQEDIDEVDALLHTYDDDLKFIILEISPPIGSVTLTLETSDECWTIQAQLEAKSYVAGVSCEPWQPVDLDDPDAPVTNLPNVE